MISVHPRLALSFVSLVIGLSCSLSWTYVGHAASDFATRGECERGRFDSTSNVGNRRVHDGLPMILTLTELDQGGGSRQLSRESAVVDINSRVHLRINTDALQNRLEGIIGRLEIPEHLVAQITAFRAAIRKGVDALGPLQKVLEEWVGSKEHSSEQIAGLRASLSSVAEPADIILSIAVEGSRMESSLSSALEAYQRPTQAQQYRMIFEVAQSELEQMQKEWETVLQSKGVYLQAGAWILTNQGEQPIHLRGFDSYKEKERLEVERFNIKALFKNDQKAEFQKAAQQAQEINDKGFWNVVEESSLRAAESFLTEPRQRIEEIHSLLEELRQMPEKAIQPAKDILGQVSADMKEYLDCLSSLFGKYGGQSTERNAKSLLVSSQSDFANLVERTKKLRSDLDDLKKKLHEIRGLVGSAKQSVENLVQFVSAFGETTLTNAMSDLGRTFRALANLYTMEDINNRVLEFGNEVLKHDLNTLPTETEAALTTSGPRAEGDHLVFKIAFGSIGNQVTELERSDAIILRSLSHLDLAIGVIFAKNGDKFQAAPSYSVLYKFGSSSYAYKRFVDIGLGLNLAAMDFNHDDTPELGVGAVVSAFHDYVQIGLIGFNIYQSKYYWFFGLRLPLPTSIGSVPTGE